MKPYELFAALANAQGLGPLPLAKKMGKPKLQPQLHRYLKGEVKEPARTTAVPLAAYFGLPVEAVYDEKLATSIGRERGISALPAELRVASKARAKPAVPEDKDLAYIIREYGRMSAGERKRLKLLVEVAKDGAQPSESWRRPDSAGFVAADPAEAGSSGLGELDESKSTKRRR